ncbi:hypothetical protein BGX26_001074 [Mortierella sp. AD094]|nr:hypothetical protein BGX26_001074 [Mortierella sp. AD094]
MPSLFCLVDGQPTSQVFEVEIDRNACISRLKDAIKAKKSKAFRDIDADGFTLWHVSLPISPKKIILSELTPDEKGRRLDDPSSEIEEVFGAEPQKKTIHVIVKPQQVNDVINKVVLNLAGLPAIWPEDDMPLMDLDFKGAITWITKNVENNVRGSTSKPDFHMLVSGGAPGIDFGTGIRLVEMYYNILDPSIIIGLRIAYCYFVEGKYDMRFEVFRDRVKEKK